MTVTGAPQAGGARRAEPPQSDARSSWLQAVGLFAAVVGIVSLLELVFYRWSFFWQQAPQRTIRWTILPCARLALALYLTGAGIGLYHGSRGAVRHLLVNATLQIVVVTAPFVPDAITLLQYHLQQSGPVTSVWYAFLGIEFALAVVEAIVPVFLLLFLLRTMACKSTLPPRPNVTRPPGPVGPEVIGALSVLLGAKVLHGLLVDVPQVCLHSLTGGFSTTTGLPPPWTLTLSYTFDWLASAASAIPRLTSAAVAVGLIAGGIGLLKRRHWGVWVHDACVGFSALALALGFLLALGSQVPLSRVGLFRSPFWYDALIVLVYPLYVAIWSRGPVVRDCWRNHKGGRCRF